ncbi:MAG TPA: class II glutamine amidotransferase [Polyangiaceae bacterium]|nr:class II glutamine amidotransferase [Polyangiaceae bacterium]
MARMFGFIGNRADLGARVLALHADVLRVSVGAGGPMGWGIGFYQAGEVLLRRRPIDERTTIDLVPVIEGVRTDVLIGHVRRPTVGALRTENTHPFRYRQWLFAQTGTIFGFASLRDRLLESQPEFLRRNVRGDTDSELFFYLFLSFLHDSGHLSDSQVAPEHIRAALRASMSLVDRLSAEEGHERNSGDLLVTNGEFLVGARRGEEGQMAYRVLAGRQDVEELLGDDGMQQARIPNVDTTHFSIVASGLEQIPQGWKPIQDRSFFTMTRAADPTFEPI